MAATFQKHWECLKSLSGSESCSCCSPQRLVLISAPDSGSSLLLKSCPLINDRPAEISSKGPKHCLSPKMSIRINGWAAWAAVSEGLALKAAAQAGGSGSAVLDARRTPHKTPTTIPTVLQQELQFIPLIPAGITEMSQPKRGKPTKLRKKKGNLCGFLL